VAVKAAALDDVHDEGELRRIAAGPATVVLDVEGLGVMLFCHATPRDEGAP
jgi:hypothetical protein